MKYVMNLNMLRQGWVATPEQKIETIMREVSNLPIAQVLSDHGVSLERQTGNRILALCPFHMDEHIGSFSINTDKNSCWCYACNNGGGVIKTISSLLKKDEVEAALIVAADENVITKEEFEQLSGQTYDASFLNKTGTNTKFKNLKKKKVRPIGKTQQLWNDVYSFMKNWWTLNETDREHLINVRSLSKERVDADYFSLNAADKSERNRFLYHLRKEFNDKYTLEDLGSVPGFYLERFRKDENFRLQMLCDAGICILIRDARNNIIGVQIRDYDENSKVRYKFLSYKVPSNLKDMKCGGTCGTPIDVLYPDQITDTTKIAIVEGKFKSEILRQQGMISLAVQGVNNYNDIEKDIADIEQRIGRNIDSIFLFYDADMLRNLAVYKAEMSLAEYIKSKRSDIKIISSIWNDVYGKGVDDCILAGYRNEIKFYDSNVMSELLDKAIEYSIKESKLDLNNLLNATKEDRTRFLDVFERYTKDSLKL